MSHFDRHQKQREFRLQLEMGPRARSEVEGTSVVRTLDNYSMQWTKC